MSPSRVGVSPLLFHFVSAWYTAPFGPAHLVSFHATSVLSSKAASPHLTGGTRAKGRVSTISPVSCGLPTASIFRRIARPLAVYRAGHKIGCRIRYICSPRCGGSGSPRRMARSASLGICRCIRTTVIALLSTYAFVGLTPVFFYFRVDYEVSPVSHRECSVCGVVHKVRENTNV